jgi:hypothetical protein
VERVESNRRVALPILDASRPNAKAVPRRQDRLQGLSSQLPVVFKGELTGTVAGGIAGKLPLGDVEQGIAARIFGREKR